MTDDPQSVAELYAGKARENYERDGDLAPILVFHRGDQQIICLMKGSENMPNAYGRTLAIGATIFQPDYVVTVTEVWMKAYHYTDRDEAMREADRIRRGDLEKKAKAGDESVKTALMTIAWTMDPTQHVSVIDMVLDDKSYKRTVTFGEAEGYMIDCVIGGWKHGLSLPPPPVELPDELLAQLLGIGGDVVAVSISR
jgi:hypothetical protein